MEKLGDRGPRAIAEGSEIAVRAAESVREESAPENTNMMTAIDKTATRARLATS